MTQSIYTITDSNNTRHTLNFKWTVSRGQDTYGYNICSLYVDGVKVASCNGGGYDMQGTVFAEYLNQNYSEQLERLAWNELKEAIDTQESRYYNHAGGGFYGLIVSKYKGENTYSCNALCDGGCGMSSMRQIAEAMGLKLEFIHEQR